MKLCVGTFALKRARCRQLQRRIETEGSPADRDGSFTGAVYEDRDDKHRITWKQTLRDSQPNGDGVRAHLERLKLARAEEETGPPSHQSKARKSLALPEAEQARADLNESDGDSFLLARKLDCTDADNAMKPSASAA